MVLRRSVSLREVWWNAAPPRNYSCRAIRRGVVADPAPDQLVSYRGPVDPKDAPILAAAVQAACPWLVTFNVRHFQPGHPTIIVVCPGQFVQQVLSLLA
jgi:hypothetical protein